MTGSPKGIVGGGTNSGAAATTSAGHTPGTDQAASAHAPSTKHPAQ